jgi:hypothetical protein
LTDAKAISGTTSAVATRFEAARPSRRIRVVVTMIVNSVAKTAPARLVRSRRSARLNSMEGPAWLAVARL